MGASWAVAIPRVTVDRSHVAKRVTLIVPYYENAEFFEFQIKHWRTYPPELRDYLSIVIVDDGSPVQPAQRVLQSIGQPKYLRLFRIDRDVRWNWLAARNIGAHEALDGWLLLTDMDHVLPIETLDALVYGVHRSDTAYAFQRREHTGESIAPHSCSWFMTKKLFWKVGGYDERCSGFYGSDGLYRRRLAETAKLAILPEHLTRYEFVGDSSTTRYARKQPEDAELKKLVATFPKDSRPKTLSFAYAEVAC